jgi:drug/metabolite transporter (DMT)-like permease
VTGLLFGLAAALTWGVSDYLGGIVSRRLPVFTVAILVQSAGALCYAAAGIAAGVPTPTLAMLAPGLVTGVAMAGGQVAFFRALSLGTMGIVAPISATGAALPVLVTLARGDAPSALGFAGVLAAGVGIFLACRRKDDVHAERGALHAERRSIVWALVAALTIGLLLVGLDIGARRSLAWTLIASRTTAVVTLAACRPWLPSGPAARGGLREQWRLLAAVGVLNTGAMALYTQGTRTGLLSIVAMSASLHSIVTALLAAWLLRERLQRVQRVGVVLATLAVLAMASGQ